MKFYSYHLPFVAFFLVTVIFSLPGDAKALAPPPPYSMPPVDPPKLESISPANTQPVKQLARLGLGILWQVVWSPDGKGLAICGDGGIWLYRTDTLNSQPQLFENSSTCYRLVFSPDGLWIASIPSILPVFGTHVVQVWEIETGKLHAELRWAGDDPGNIYTLALSPDSSEVAFGGDVRTEIWNFKSNNQRYFDFDSCGGETLGIAFSPDAKSLAATDQCGTQIWDAQTGERKQHFEFSGYDIVFSPDGKTLALTDYGGVRLLDISGGQRAVLASGEEGFSARFSPDSNKIFTGNNNAIIEWDTRLYTRLRIADNPILYLDDVVISPDYSLAAGIKGASYVFGQVVIWEIGKRNPKTILDSVSESRWVRLMPTNLPLPPNTGNSSA